jgi:hypothetical protein
MGIPSPGLGHPARVPKVSDELRENSSDLRRTLADSDCPARGHRVYGGSRSGAMCGLPSGAAARKDAELIPLWVGKYDPALIACLADVGVPGT